MLAIAQRSSWISPAAPDHCGDVRYSLQSVTKVGRIVRRGEAAMKLVLSPRVVSVVELAILIALTSAGVFAPQGPRIWYASLLEGFAIVAIPTLIAGVVVTW